MNNLKNRLIQKLVDASGEPFVNLRTTELAPEWHHDFILHIASIIRPKVYVELGLRRCPLFNRMIPFADKLIGVDIDRAPEQYMIKNPKASFVCMPTSQYAETLKAKPIEIDLLFIDADHSEKAVFEDFNSFFPYIKPHGLIILHDGHPKSEEWLAPHLCDDSYKAIEALSKNVTEYEMMTIPFHPGLTLCRKRKNQLSWKEPK